MSPTHDHRWPRGLQCNVGGRSQGNHSQGHRGSVFQAGRRGKHLAHADPEHEGHVLL